MSWYAEDCLPLEIRDITKPKTQPHTLSLPQSNFTFGTVLSGRSRSSGICQIRTRPSDCQIKKRDLSLQSAYLLCPKVQCAVHHSMQLFGQGNPLNEAPTFCGYTDEVRNSSALATFTQHAPQQLLTLLCDFMRFSTLWLTCCDSVMFLLLIISLTVSHGI